MSSAYSRLIKNATQDCLSLKAPLKNGPKFIVADPAALLHVDHTSREDSHGIFKSARNDTAVENENSRHIYIMMPTYADRLETAR